MGQVGLVNTRGLRDCSEFLVKEGGGGPVAGVPVSNKVSKGATKVLRRLQWGVSNFLHTPKKKQKKAKYPFRTISSPPLMPLLRDSPLLP